MAILSFVIITDLSVSPFAQQPQRSWPEIKSFVQVLNLPEDQQTAINALIQTLNLSDQQQNQIRDIVDAHRVAVQTAKDRGDLLAMQAELQIAIVEIERLLTPDQLTQVNDAVRKFKASRRRGATATDR
jgi:hypothetical protein